MLPMSSIALPMVIRPFTLLVFQDQTVHEPALDSFGRNFLFDVGRSIKLGDIKTGAFYLEILYVALSLIENFLQILELRDNIQSLVLCLGGT